MNERAEIKRMRAELKIPRSKFGSKAERKLFELLTRFDRKRSWWQRIVVLFSKGKTS